MQRTNPFARSGPGGSGPSEAAPAREQRPDPERAPGLIGSFAGYTAIFALFSVPWLMAAPRGAPRGYFGNAADERLVVWVLAWVQHAIATGVNVLDANINFPAPAQLTGTEHFVAFQILFAPLYALTGNALLAANLTVFLTYPLAALAMQRLLLALDCAPGVAWVIGLVFALGPFRVPGHLHLLQYSNLFLPLVALALTRLRARPGIGNAALLGLALACGVLSSYYMAVLCGVLALVWGSLELFHRAGARARFAVLAVGTGVLVALVLLLASLPYLARPEAEREPVFNLASEAAREYMMTTIASQAIRSGGVLVLLLSGLGLVGFLVRDRGARTCATRGLVLTVLAQLMAIGAVWTVDGVTLPMPFALIAMSPLRFFRYPMRFAVLVGFGTSLLCAAVLQSAYTSLGRRVGRTAAALLAIAILATRAWHLSGTGIAEFTGQTDPAYAMVARLSQRHGPGPLLELPMVDPLADRKDATLGTEAEAMLGSTRHWLPLIGGFTGYQPPHRPLALHLAELLPDPPALQRLVDLTHMRWLLLRPVESWPGEKRKQREEIRTSKLFLHAASHAGWVLLRVRKEPRNDKWYDAVAAGPQPGQTLLGTPLAPLAPDDTAALVTGVIPPTLAAGRWVAIVVHVKNMGAAAWPVSALDPDAPVVRLVLEWWPADGGTSAAPLETKTFLLPLDVEPAEDVALLRWIRTLDQPGDYDIRFRVEQVGSDAFTSPKNQFLQARIRLEPAGGA